MKNQKGFIQIIVIIILIIVVVSLLGISLKEIFSRLSDNPMVGDNFKFVKDWLIDVYNKYLSGVFDKMFDALKDAFSGIFRSAVDNINNTNMAPISSDQPVQ